MKLDPIVLGKDYMLDGSEVGVLRPNDNVLADACSGCGKSKSLLFPTMARMEHMNPVALYAKEEDAYHMAAYMQAKGYQIEFLNVNCPEKSTVSFDPVAYVDCYEDIESLSTSVVYSTLEKTVDAFWNANAVQLQNGLIAGAMMIHKNPGMKDVLDLFDKTAFPEQEYNGSSADDIFGQIEQISPGSYAAREYYSWRAMPEKTASSVRATLKGAVNAVFPEGIRNMMRDKPQVDFRKLGSEKMALFLITDAAERWQGYYTNLFWHTCIKQLRKIADASPGGHLLRPVRLYFDDFACTSVINDFDKNISLFRSFGISCMILLQSQTQLESMYGADKAAIIRQNCPVQLYFPGGFDEKSCELVSKKMDIPFEDVLYAPMGKVFVMASGRKPAVVPRYETFQSKEYQEYLKANYRQDTAESGGIEILGDCRREEEVKMENRFYRPGLEKNIEGSAKEKRIRAAVRGNRGDSPPGKQEILEVLEWMERECSCIEGEIRKRNAERQNMEVRREELVCMPQIHQILLAELEVCDLNLPVRISRILHREQVDKVSQLCAMTEEEVAGIQDLGKRAVGQIRDRLDGFGLSLKNSRRRKTSVPDEEDIFYNGLEEELERRFIDLFGQTDGESEEW